MSSSPSVDATESKSPEATPADAKSQANENDKTCVVCFKIVDIFSIGECDHPVCYECSTRMRVLCKQNECPICRRINQKVIFTSEIGPYKELDQKNRSGLYDKTFRISFTGQRAQNAFRRLLEHPCNKCNAGPFDTAADLKDHLRKKHELFYCDICMEHLKIFSFERRAYTREQLAMHRRKGDPDNKSHRGHPLCEYCDQRYLDRDELFRHLRKEHYFCHYCDADGSNQFYADHTTLREHFVDQHFLCEEGECRSNIFSAVFRTDIDLKAHKASVHGQTSKQARTIEFQFNLAPRNHRNNQSREPEPSLSASEPTMQTSSTAMPTQVTAKKIIDARNEQEFPSLGNAPVTIRPTVPLNTRQFGTSGLARTKENFPALGGSSRNVEPISAAAKPGNASTLLFKTPKPAPKAAANSATKAPAAKTVPNTTNDFPALPGSSASAKTRKQILESDMVEAPLPYNLSAVSSKHRTLVQSYESVSSSNSLQANQKIKTVQRVETKPQSTANGLGVSINSKANFPALGGSSGPAPPPQWLNATSSNGKKQPQISKKLKVAPAPLLPTLKKAGEENSTSSKPQEAKKEKNKNEKAKSQTNNERKNNDGQVEKASANKKTEKNPTKKSDEKENVKKDNEKNGTGTQTKNEKKANKNHTLSSNETNSNKPIQNGHISPNESLSNSYSSVAHFTMPPPGFPAKTGNEKVTKIPPGFEHMGDMNRTFSYISPSNALLRNKILVSLFTKSLKDESAVEEFRTISKLFREGACNTRAYYEHCEVVLGDRFESIFPELLVLLPDIIKQQELYEVYFEKHKQSNTNELTNYIQICDLCRQILKSSDFPEHWKCHIEIEKDNKLNKNFPKLNK